MPKKPPTYITVREAMEVSGYSDNTILRWIRAGLVNGIQLEGPNKVLAHGIDLESLKAFLETKGGKKVKGSA